MTESSSEPEAPGSPRLGILIWIGVAVGVVLLIAPFFAANTPSDAVSFGTVVEDAKAGRIDTIKVSGTSLKVSYYAANGRIEERNSEIAETTDIAALLIEQGVAISRRDAAEGAAAVNLEFEAEQSSTLGSLFSVLLNILPFLFIGGFIFLVMRQSGSVSSQGVAFGKSHARVFAKTSVAVTFSDVAGVDEAKAELSEIVEFLQRPDKFSALGARIPKGVLLLGPPGTGKTLLAKAVAGEAGVPFFSISGSEFVEMFVGVGASRVRDLFEQAKKSSPCIVFLDEIDAVGRQRGTGLGGSHDEREQTLNQILVEMDGFEAGTNVVVIAATNRPDILDPALVRPGRFDRKVVLDAPDVRGRQAILKVHTKGKPIDEAVSVETLAKATPGFTGADLANLVNEAAILAARRELRTIGPSEFEEAIDRVLAGPERKSRLLSPLERKRTAYHESGHVVVAHFMEHHDRPQKVTIVSRGVMGGYTRFLPEEEARFKTPEMLQDQLCAALGGYAAEKLVFGSPSTGPSNDLEQVATLARNMVTRWGMSERLGPVAYGKSDDMVFLGRDLATTRDFSETTAAEIDAEVRRLVEAARTRAEQVLRGNRAVLERVAQALLEAETLQGDELDRLLLSSEPTGPYAPTPRGPTSDQRPRHVVGKLTAGEALRRSASRETELFGRL